MAHAVVFVIRTPLLMPGLSDCGQSRIWHFSSKKGES